MQTVVDKEITKVLNAFCAKGWIEDTLIVPISDHGEMSLVHGDLRQKMERVHKETIRVPSIFPSRKHFPKPQQTDSLTRLVDVLPT